MIQFVNEFDVLNSRENNPWTEKYSTSHAVEHSSQGFWTRAGFMGPQVRQFGNRARLARGSGISLSD